MNEPSAESESTRANVQRQQPFGPLRPRKRYTLDPDRICPVVRIAHRLNGPMRTADRIILDHELVLILRGKGVFVVDGETITFGAHDVMLARPFVPHRFVADGTCEHVAVHFDFTLDVPPRLPLAERKPYDVVLPQCDAIASHIALGAGHPAEAAMLDIVRWHEKRSTSAALHARGALIAVLGDLMDHDNTATGDERLRTRLDRALVLIERDFAEPLDVETLATAADLSAAHFNRLFKQWTGRSPIDYLRRRRIEAARQLLAEVDLSIKEVAHRVGFDDPHHFSRVFRKIDGLPPSDYRQALLARARE